MPMGELRRFKMLGSQNAKDFGDWCDRKMKNLKEQKVRW